MSRFKRKKSELLTLEDESNSGDFSSGTEDIYIPDNISLSDTVTESELSSSLNSNSSRSSSRMQIQNDSHKSKFDTYFNIDLKGTNRDKIARCRICLNSKEIKMSRGNTTGLRKHLRSKHPKAYFKIYPNEPNQLAEASTSRLTVPEMFAANSQLKTTSVKPNKDNFDSAIIDWMAKKYLPFNFFNDEDTQNFFKEISGKDFPKKDKLRRLAMLRFDCLKQKMTDMLTKNSSKLSFTIDGWTSISGRSYYGITTHFIDDNWELQSIALDFVPAHGKHTGKDIALTFFKCVDAKGLIHKIQGITMDNASANTTFIKELQELIPDLNVEDCHFRCFGHVINLAVQDLFQLLKLNSVANEELSDDSVDEEAEVEEIEDDSNALCKIRSIFSKIKRSEQLSIKFRSACEATGNSRQLTPVLDVPTRWNSSNDMLKVALEARYGLGVLCQNVVDLKPYALMDNEWILLEEVHKLLVNFQILSKKLGGEKYVTLPMVVVCINILIDNIESKIFKWDQKADRTAVEEQLIVSFQAARDKILKHYRKANWIYAAVLILDPRHKLEAFDMTTWGQELKDTSIQKFQDIYKAYFNQSEDSEGQRTKKTAAREREDPGPEKSDFLIDFDVLYAVNPTHAEGEWMQELQKYYSMPRCNKETDILQWWKIHASEFPILSLMARDLLSIPATSVPAERLFSRAALTIRKHRNRLNNESARCLLCLNDWVKNKMICKREG